MLWCIVMDKHCLCFFSVVMVDLCFVYGLEKDIIVSSGGYRNGQVGAGIFLDKEKLYF